MSESDYAERPRDHGTSGHPSGVTVPGWPAAFRGSQAIAAGLVTRGRLRGPRFQRLLPDVYRRAVAKPDLLLRSLGRVPASRGPRRARRLRGGPRAGRRLRAAPRHASRGHRGGRPSCAAGPDGPPGSAHRQRGHPGARRRLHHSVAHGVRPGPTAGPRGGGRRGGPAGQPPPLPPRSPHGAVRARSGSPWCCALPDVVALANPYAGSPMETRLRLLIVRAGQPPAEVAVGGARPRHPRRSGSIGPGSSQN